MPQDLNDHPDMRPRKHYVTAVFWLAVAALLLWAGFAGVWWGILLGLLSLGYSIYLFAGGRHAFWVW